jgi:hypothetical protein
VQKGVLHLQRQGGGDPVDVVFLGMAPLRFQVELVPVLVLELDHLVLDGGAVPWAHAFDAAGVEGALV